MLSLYYTYKIIIKKIKNHKEILLNYYQIDSYFLI
jgi:hypothetical protein